MRKIVISFMMLMTTGFVLAAPVAPTVFADSATDSACAAIDCDDTTQGPSVNSLLKLVLNTLSVILGFIAVVMIIFNAFRFITSAGESSKVAAARNGIVYALIGLAIAALAQVLVYFVINRVNSAQNPASAKPTAAQCKKNPKLKDCK